MTGHELHERVGRNVRRVRRRKGLTRARLAKVSGYAQQYVSGLEQGRRNPTITTIYRIARALGA